MVSSQAPEIESVEQTSPDLVAENIERLKELFPEIVADGKVDLEAFRDLLGDEVDDSDEKFGLGWHGKRRARQLALTPSTGTLRPAPENSVDWDSTRHLMIEGDNLEVLKLLQRSYGGRVKLIYIDPPYNTGGDFVYKDDFKDNIANYLEITGQTEDGSKVSSNTETSGRFHTEWLNMMYPRLKLARQLLRNDGAIAISMDDGEQARLHQLCDEIFGGENHVATIVWQKRYVSNVTAKYLSDMHDYIAVYARDRELVSIRDWERTEDQLEAYKNPDDDPRGVWRAQDLSASRPYSAGRFTIIGATGERFDPPPNRYWRCNEAQFEEWVDDDRIWWGVNRDARPMLKSFLSESERGITPHTWWNYEFAGHNKEATLELKALFDGDAPFDTPKPVKLMKRLLSLISQQGDLVLDFFAGSAPMGHAVYELSAEEGLDLRFALVQFPEPTERPDYANIAEIAEERLRRAADKVREEKPDYEGDLGFRVFKLDSSNIRAWDPQPENLKDTLLEHVDHLKEDRSEQDVLYELLLKLGLDLCVPIETNTIANKTVHSIGAGTLFACLDETIKADTIEDLALGIVKWRDTLDPAGDTTVVFRDSAFPDDVTKTNLDAILKQHNITTVRSI